MNLPDETSKVAVKVYEKWMGSLVRNEPLRHDLWKWGVNLDGTYESDKHITTWYEEIGEQWYSVSYNNGQARQS